MSSVIAVKRLPKHEEFAHSTKPSCAPLCSPSGENVQSRSVLRPMKSPPVELFTESDLELRLRDALRERDEQWRRHERAQISFLQNEGTLMLKGLHEEIERLNHLLRDARRKLDVGGEDEVSEKEELRNTIREQEARIAELEGRLAQKESSLADIERRVNSSIEKMNETMKIQSDRIRQLSGELQDRTLTVTQLSGQLRQYRLREAMATAQHRRRASQQTTNGSPPLVSPSSPHRLFPPKSLLTGASVSVTYPGSMSKSAIASSIIDDTNMEKPKATPRRKSASSFSSSMCKN